MHDHMLSVLYGSSLIRKMLDCVALTCMVTRSFSKRKRLVYGCRVTIVSRYTPVATVDELWYRVEASMSSVPAHAIQSLLTHCAGVEVLLLLPEGVFLGLIS
ncbi:hypothetical protein TNCV_4005861 [Trichonephila clavipes]|nr:hypothetical protein TNCV_4005861 [Trichonephila clavipes]